MVHADNAPWLKLLGKKHKKSLKYPKGSMYDVVKEAAEENSEAIAYNYFGNAVTYLSFLSQVDRAAQSFASMGVKKGDVVSICAPNIPEAIIAIYAANKIGAICNIFHPLSAQSEIKYYLNLTNSKILVAVDLAWDNIQPILAETEVKQVIIISPGDSLPIFSQFSYKMINKPKEMRKTLVRILTRNKKTTLSWSDFLARGTFVVSEIYEKMRQNDVAAILYSGGTTGKSKGIALTNLAFNATACQAKNALPDFVAPGKSILGIMPIFHGFGLGVGVHTILANGMTIDLLPKLDAKHFDKIISSLKPNAIVGVPTLFEALIRNKKIKKLDLSFIELTISGGDNMNIELKKEIDEFLRQRGSKVSILQGYGLTEALSMVSLNLFDANKDGSIGIPLANNLVKIIDPQSYKEMPRGEIGEIVLNGPTVMESYINDEIETNKNLQQHADGKVWLHTGDMGYMDEQGFIFFAGRLKRMIISSGYNIYPNEVEEVIMRVDEVLLATVIGVDDKYRGQIAKAFVVLKDGVSPNTEIREKIMESCRVNLAKYKWPRALEFKKSLPRTKIGKVDYKKLK